MVYLLLLTALFLSRALFLSPLPAFFDSPEYEKLISNPNLLQGLTNGHEPIHPGFILPSWYISHSFGISPLYAGELTAAFFATLSLFVFYLIGKRLFNRAVAIRALIIASLLPFLWLAGINLLTDTTYIFFFLLSFYSYLNWTQKKENKWFMLSLFSLSYSVFTHLQVIVWTIVFIGPLITQGNIKKRSIFEAALLVFGGIFLGIMMLISTLMAAETSFTTSVYSLFFHSADLIVDKNFVDTVAKLIRNLVVILIRNNTTLLVLAAFAGAVRLYRSNSKFKVRNLIICLLWIFPAIVTSQYWHIGLYGRISLMASFPIALLAAQIRNRLVFAGLVLNLIIVSVPLVLTYKNATVLRELNLLYGYIPKNALLISSNLIRPQVTYTGEKYFVNEPGQDTKFIEEKVNHALRQNRPVYIDSQALYNPYYSYDGNHLHILSLGKIGNSEISPLFEKYKIRIVKVIDAENRIFLYQINPSKATQSGLNQGIARKGSEVFLYSDGVNKNRIDARDIGSLIWETLLNKKDPMLWTIADSTNFYQFPKN